jgi:hypothetical protein
LLEESLSLSLSEEEESDELVDDPLSSTLQLGPGAWYCWRVVAAAAAGGTGGLGEGFDDAVDDGLDGLGVGWLCTASMDGLRAVGTFSGVVTVIHLLKGTEIEVSDGWLMLYIS